MDEFNEEQRVMIGVLQVQGHPDPESVVRAAPLQATVMGSRLMPSLVAIAEASTKVLALIEPLQRQLVRRERRRRMACLFGAFLISAIMWWGIIAAVRWLA